MLGVVHGKPRLGIDLELQSLNESRGYGPGSQIDFRRTSGDALEAEGPY